MKECIKPFIFFYLQTFYDISLFLSLLFSLLSLSHLPLSLSSHFIHEDLIPTLFSLLHSPLCSQSFCNIPFLQVRPDIMYQC
jgi:hypothetical protein